MTRFCAISDLHGNLPELDLEKFDVLLIAGDIIPLSIQNDLYNSRKWIHEVFNSWCEKIGKKIILVAGNHDFIFNNYIYETNNPGSINLAKNVVYLQNYHYMTLDYNIYGTPFCHKFGDWAFMPDDKTQELVFNNIVDLPRNVPYIFVCHDAPFGVSDICFESPVQEHIGNNKLRNAIDRIKPDWVIHGHLHSSNHGVEMLNDTKVVNVSLLNEKYERVFQPFYFEA